MSRHLVTSALPYANGPIHFGHVIGAYLPADVYVRTLRMLGENVLFVCGADEHGVAITIGAEEAGMPYGEYAAKWNAEMKRLFDALHVEFDVWSGTSTCPHHAELSLEIFRQLRDNGYLSKRSNDQLYCPNHQRFLADRYVSGTCPKCGHEPVRGDECPSCGSWLDALDLVSPTCALCGTTPELRKTTHWYLELEKLRDEHIGDWFRAKEWKPNVRSFVEGLLADVPARAITRDLGWGVPLPPEDAEGEEGKVLYVWFDAPIGYISFSKEWAEAKGEPDAWKAYWLSADTQLVHFIGKDNIPFHCVVFPSMLWGTKAGYVLPQDVPANEFYNLQGRKFSTSGNWSIPLDEFFERYDAEAARFYLLTSAPETSDSEWQWEGFRDCVNALLADTIGNLVTRVLRFAAKNYEGAIPALHAEHEEELDDELLTRCGPIGDPAEHVRAFRFRRAAEELIANARVANVFVDRQAPWALRKTDPAKAESVVNTCCQWIALMARWMAPFLPGKAQELWEMLGQRDRVEESGWPEAPVVGSWRPLDPGTPLGEVRGLFAKLDDEDVQRELDALAARASS